jgi:hypothetical protein
MKHNGMKINSTGNVLETLGAEIPSKFRNLFLLK